MSIDKENLFREMQSLSTRFGGSLFSEKQRLDQDAVTVFFGLGGLGGRAVNEIKAAANERLNNPEKRFFAVVDTCKGDMEKISAATVEDIQNIDKAEQGANKIHGCIEEDEKIPLFSESFKISKLPADVDSWLDRTRLAETEINDLGAQGKRQIGRVMLLCNGNYERVFNKIKVILEKAKETAITSGVKMRIYIVSGISGGTGSGTTVDFTYMVKKAIELYPDDCKYIDAILFTPDVQYNDDPATITEDKKRGLRRNFYAAIKEIDYFFNAKAKGISYTCPYGESSKAYKDDIFDACTLVSRYAEGLEIARNSNEVIKKVAEAITFEISGIQGVSSDTGKAQPYSSHFSNIADNFELWWPSNSDGKGLNMPDWAPSRYSSFAYSSFYIPRDELMAYCANLLLEQLVKHWTERDVTQKDIDELLRKNSLKSNRMFADKLFDLASLSKFFDEIDKSELPVDSLFMPVKNCHSYLELLKETALAEGHERKIDKHLQKTYPKIEATFVAPLVKTVNEAFTNEKKGPVYAINLLSAGNVNKYSEKQGVLAKIKELYDGITAEVQVWSLELQDVYQKLTEKADSYDGKLSIPSSDLESFTNDCYKYATDLIKCKLLSYSTGIMQQIYNLLNEKNHNVFQIYTYTFQYLVDIIKKDSEYTTTTNRHREGQTTVFTFDMTDFRNDEKSNRLKEYFKHYVDDLTITEQSKIFVNMIFGQLKRLLDTHIGEENEKDAVTPAKIVEIVRNYFNTAFPDWASTVTEKFCVVAYATDVEATPAQIDKIWGDQTKKKLALQKAADAIQNKLKMTGKVMLTCADASRDITQFSSYTSNTGLQETENINELLGSPNKLENNWSEFILYKRIFGFPLGFLADIDKYMEDYNAFDYSVGVHLDEMRDEFEDFGDWRYSLPEPYSYTVAKELKKFKDGGRDVTEKDRRHMLSLYEMATKAKELGILVEMKKGGKKDKEQDKKEANSEITYYTLVWKLQNSVDFAKEYNTIYDKISTTIAAFEADRKPLDFISVIKSAGFTTDNDTDIYWNFKRTEYGVMKNCTALGNSVIFGNLIVLLRSNPHWEEYLRKGIELFSRFREIYDAIIAETKLRTAYERKINLFIKAVRAGRFVPVIDNGLFVGYKLKLTDDPEEDIVFSNAGFDILDQNFFLYLAYTESFIKLNEHDATTFEKLLEHKFMERIERNDTSIANVRSIIEDCTKVLTNENYLAHYDINITKENIEKRLKQSTFTYSVPLSSKAKTDVNAVIENLKSFYKFIKDELTENLKQDAQNSTSTQQTPQQNDGWACACGTNNTGKFCQGCGTKKPEPQTGWFCPECGTQNTGNFCQSCGTKKTSGNIVACPDCGWKPEPGSTPNFCQGCGHKF